MRPIEQLKGSWLAQESQRYFLSLMQLLWTPRGGAYLFQKFPIHWEYFKALFEKYSRRRHATSCWNDACIDLIRLIGRSGIERY